MAVVHVLKANASWLLVAAFVGFRYLYPSFWPHHSKILVAAIFTFFVLHALLVLGGKIRFSFNTFRHPTDPEGVRNLFFGMDLFTFATVLIASSYIWWLGGGYVFLAACGIAALEAFSAIVDYCRGRELDQPRQIKNAPSS